MHALAPTKQHGLGKGSQSETDRAFTGGTSARWRGWPTAAQADRGHAWRSRRRRGRGLSGAGGLPPQPRRIHPIAGCHHQGRPTIAATTGCDRRPRPATSACMHALGPAEQHDPRCAMRQPLISRNRGEPVCSCASSRGGGWPTDRRELSAGSAASTGSQPTALCPSRYVGAHGAINHCESSSRRRTGRRIPARLDEAVESSSDGC